MTRAGHTLARTCRFVRDEAGSVLVLWIMSLVAVLAFVALVFDMGRVQVTHGELQSFADSVALAAAGELDGQPNAIARATAAAAEVADTNVYGGDGTLSAGEDWENPVDYTLAFLRGLPEPALDNYHETDDPSGFETDDDAVARLVRVSVTPVSLGVSFLAATRALTGSTGGDTMSMRAEAIAGFTMEACDITPLMVCLPRNWHADGNIGDGIELRSRGTGASWSPGEFGFLQNSLLNTDGPCGDVPPGQESLCHLAAAGPVTKCFAQNGVHFRTGQAVGTYAAAINVRFDIYEGNLNGDNADPLYAPAPNRISGIAVTRKGSGQSGNYQCDYDTSTDTIGLPPDDCFEDGDCPAAFGGRFGDGDWDRKKYFGVNYLDMDLYELDGNGDPVIDDNGDPVPTAFSGLTYAQISAALPTEMDTWLSAQGVTPETATRFEIYQAENAVSGDILMGHDETGRPICNTSYNPGADVLRRNLIVAGVVCTDEDDNDLYSGSATNVPVEEFLEIFLTNPAHADGTGTDTKFTFYGEVVRSVGKKGLGGAGDGGKFRDVVQLYR